MVIDLATLKTTLCSQLCQEVDVVKRHGLTVVSLPLPGDDGDFLSVYIEPNAGGWRLSDRGSTLMRLSYEYPDINKFLVGSRGEQYEETLQRAGAHEDDGNIYIDVESSGLAHGLFELGQLLGRVSDLKLWTRARVASTFLDDLRDTINRQAPADKIHESYLVPDIENPENYVVDFKIDTGTKAPLFLFGVNSSAKARLVTIALQHFDSLKISYDSMVVLSGIKDVPTPDLTRLLVAANDIVPSLTDESAIGKKIRHRIAQH